MSTPPTANKANRQGTVLITGASGRVGREILAQLPVGVNVRVGRRDPQQTIAPAPIATTYVTFDLTQPETIQAALKGVTRVFLLWPSGPTSQVKAFIDAAAQSAVEHIVFLSILKADQLRIVPHRRIEQHLEKSSLSYTFLRAGYFMQNFSSIHACDIQQRHDIYIPGGNGRTALVDARDVAAVAVRALMEDGHENQAYDITGSEALTFTEVAAILSDVLGFHVHYANPTIAAFWHRYRREYQVDPTLVLFMIAEYTAGRFGLANAVAAGTPDLLNRPPISFRQFAEDHQHSWT